MANPDAKYVRPSEPHERFPLLSQQQSIIFPVLRLVLRRAK